MMQVQKNRDDKDLIAARFIQENAIDHVTVEDWQKHSNHKYAAIALDPPRIIASETDMTRLTDILSKQQVSGVICANPHYKG